MGDSPISYISCDFGRHLEERTHKYIILCLFTIWEEPLLNIMEYFFCPNNFIFPTFVLPATKLMVGKVLKLIILILECLDNFTEVWFSNLLFDCLINHWPECWGLPVDILNLLGVTFRGFVWLASLPPFPLLEYCGDKLPRV